MRNRLTLLTAILTGVSSLAIASEHTAPDYNREIRPILSQFCFKCHGMDDKSRKSGLRLDTREGALAEAKSGSRAIVPGKPDESELIARIILKPDHDEVMPPSSTNLKLAESQKQKLKEWIADGAPYSAHWAFLRPVQPAVPVVAPAEAVVKNPIDAFIAARLKKEGLKQSPEADRYTLARRAHLDLIGLPPTPAETEAFVSDTSPGAYEKLVDRLLASPRYGERWGRRWLDLARYADTNGYEKDRARTIWPFRDWVVKSLNADMPFDQFTIKQIAGDMLPNATPDDHVATGFHRNTMLNEEGGIDPLEFRYYATVDRVATTGAAWLGLTLGCCQCHTHKYDPVLHTDYFGVMAFLNNADEPDYEIPDAEREKKRVEIEAKIAALRKDLPSKWTVPTDVDWKPLAVQATAESKVKIDTLADGSTKFGGTAPEKDVYTLTFETDGAPIDRLKLDVIKGDKDGPGRTPHGNFVLSEFTVTIAPKNAPDKVEAVKLAKATADFSQKDFDIAAAIDGKPETGWAIADSDGKLAKSHNATFMFEKPVQIPAGARWTVKLDQGYGTKHVISQLKLSTGVIVTDKRPIEERRKEAIEKRFTEWEKTETEKAIAWTVLKPADMKSSMPFLVQQADGSILASGDVTKSDTYDLTFVDKLKGVTAIRLEVLPHDSLPGDGPGMAYYEGQRGDFFLSEFHILNKGERIKPARATHSHAKNNKAELTQDGEMSSGWSTAGDLGKPHAAVFTFAAPIDFDGTLALKMMFERHFACPLGHFRISVATEPKPAEARGLVAEIESLLAKPAAQRTAEEKEAIFQAFLDSAPEMAAGREELKKLRNSIPRLQTSLAMRERPAKNTRPTLLYHRGEYTQPKERIEPHLPSVLPGLPAGAPSNRLSFAKWLVSNENPLTARVTVNRQWQAFFGRGLVKTLEDFGYQGELPSHPELLDWLAVEFMNKGWSLKTLHRWIVTSATYRQSSGVSADLGQRDPYNILLARGPRVRLEAEIIRDSALAAAGLLSDKMGGPGVFPPQPESVTTEGTYGALQWKASAGPDRYRRSLYTFMKRTAPFAMISTFDGPTGEACLARREVSNSALQSLTLLNDAMFMEAAQALGKTLAAQAGSDEERVKSLFARCLTRAPRTEESAALTAFAAKQRERFKAKQLDAEAFAGKGEGDAAERAVWTAVARAVMNLDESITKR